MVKKLQEILGNDFEIKEVTTKKNNYDAHGIMIRKKGESVAPIFDCEMFKNDPEGLAKFYLENAADNDSVGEYVKNFQNPCWMKEHMYLRLTSDAGYAKEFLNRKIADLYMIPYIRFSEDYTVNINPTHLKLIGVTEKELFSVAMKNMDKECALYSMDDIVFYGVFGLNNSSMPNYMEKELEHRIPMITVTNRSTMLGAASIFCERIQKRLVDIFPDGFYLIPSSIHEFLAVDKNIHTLESLNEMISNTNADTVKIKDQLSDAAYYFENGVFLKTMS